MIFTGPIDEYFGFRFGRLPYRSLRFAHVTEDREWAQPVAVINYPQTEDYTRVTEYKHLTGQVHPKTSLTYEYPSDTGDPYYPVPRPENEALYKRYQALAEAGLHPDCVAGISIGAINSALIAGNAPDKRVERLEEQHDDHLKHHLDGGR